MISFVFSDYDYYYSDYLQSVCLVVNPNTLGGKPKVYGGTNLGGNPRLSYMVIRAQPDHQPKTTSD